LGNPDVGALSRPSVASKFKSKLKQLLNGLMDYNFLDVRIFLSFEISAKVLSLKGKHFFDFCKFFQFF